MRYLNWDVLLFPGSSRVPIQEFKTACYVVHDSELLHEDMIANGSEHHQSLANRSPVRQVPIVACFLANQNDGSPFKVSIHSWLLPEPSRDLKRIEAVGRDRLAVYEARVIVDGICVGSTMMMPNQTFPQIIEHSFQVDKNGQRDLLRWPMFHQELLSQNYWNAGENIGRIKVTIAEGFVHGRQESPFIRTKNLVTFSFQHAPQCILENSGIAWPNKGMWMPPPQPLYNTAPSTHKDDSLDPELHAHSPVRQDSASRRLIDLSRSTTSNYSKTTPMGPPPVGPIQNQSRVVQGISWDRDSRMPDPFVEPQRNNQQNLDSYVTHYPLEDYTNKFQGNHQSTSSFFSTSIGSGSYQQRDTFSDILNIADSPTNNTQAGLVVSTNTRINSTDSTIEFTNDQNMKSGNQSQSSRHNSDVTMKSQFSEEHDKADQTSKNQTYHAPTSKIKSKKEGDSPRRETPPVGSKQPSEGHFGSSTDQDPWRAVGEGKRKMEKQTGRKVSMTEALDITSPRKASKHNAGDSPGDSTNNSRAGSATSRRPLSALDNV